MSNEPDYEKNCSWVPHGTNYDYSTGCGQNTTMFQSDPATAGFKYCPFCMQPILLQPDKPEVIEEVSITIGEWNIYEIAGKLPYASSEFHGTVLLDAVHRTMLQKIKELYEYKHMYLDLCK